MTQAGVLKFQFSTQDGAGSALIRYLTDSQWSHVDIVIPADICLRFGEPIATRYGLLGARMAGGVQLRGPSYAKFTRTLTLGCRVPDVQAGYAFAFRQLGKPYDKGAILDFFLHRKRAFTPDEPKWFCDELAYTAAWQAGTLLLGTENPLNLTPQEMRLSPDLTVRLGLAGSI